MKSPSATLSFLFLFVFAVRGANLTPAWVELGPTGAVARVIMDSRTDCPGVKLNGQTLGMRVRVDNSRVGHEGIH